MLPNTFQGVPWGFSIMLQKNHILRDPEGDMLKLQLNPFTTSIYSVFKSSCLTNFKLSQHTNFVSCPNDRELRQRHYELWNFCKVNQRLSISENQIKETLRGKNQDMWNIFFVNNDVVGNFLESEIIKLIMLENGDKESSWHFSIK